MLIKIIFYPKLVLNFKKKDTWINEFNEMTTNKLDSVSDNAIKCVVIGDGTVGSKFKSKN